ncbi:hypothetical protein EJ03DRAFT_160141 [Teratosphaeria nubilosa]|uniref:Uncharacterized protein n=1 Tax=Teratosphaeria nubilosa TaxID=161662 RepID=A0A6G1L313_9PEZI|nr:hypothetical protein EJ03DRAFT_160141 [Teratosphaeria nubilosa]
MFRRSCIAQSCVRLCLEHQAIFHRAFGGGLRSVYARLPVLIAQRVQPQVIDAAANSRGPCNSGVNASLSNGLARQTIGLIPVPRATVLSHAVLYHNPCGKHRAGKASLISHRCIFAI